VLFVSHNLLAVADLCPRVLVMSHGMLGFDGRAEDAIAHYRREIASTTVAADGARTSTTAELTVNGRATDGVVESAPDRRMRLDLAVDRPTDAVEAPVILNLHIQASDGRMAVHLRSDWSDTSMHLGPGRTVLTVLLYELPLAAGTYSVWLRVVGVHAGDPILWDSPRQLLIISGHQATDGVLVPRHRFEQRLEQPDGRAAILADP